MSSSSTATRAAAQIRQEFLDFFTDRHGHAFVPSSPVVPYDDPTLLFANAGMNQFKDVFLGRDGRDLARVVNSQKCIRAGGKHNDLEDVGRDTYHHTFFEMLGNWSFGDYFKAEAIGWAWELLVERWGLEQDRLFVTVFGGDEEAGLEPDTEAETIWRALVPADRISRWGTKDNFWEMGETGPCGPCSEIHYDFTSDRSGRELVNRSHPDVIEIWNLVFIQFNRGADRVLTPLPAKHVDTGMGFERITRVLQGKASNYDTDIWAPIFEAIRSSTGARAYGGDLDDAADTAYRVIADHVRCLTVAINDGAWPSNEGRGYVLRRILRRAVRHAHQTLGVEGPLLCELVPAVVETLHVAYPELDEKAEKVASVIRDEEQSFLRTLDRGLELFGEAADRATAAAAKGTPRISARDAFRLHDTYGFPIDLTRVMAEERGMQVDEAGYEAEMEAARERSRQGGGSDEPLTLPPDALAKLRHLGVEATADVDKFHGRPITAHVRAIWNARDFDNTTHVGDHVAVILNRTNFYAEAGGQVGDTGSLETDVAAAATPATRGFSGSEASGSCRFDVEDTQRVGEFTLHIGRVVEGKLVVGDVVDASVDHPRRAAIMKNHTATHLLNHALRAVLGDEVQQRGSLVAPDRLRFDFTHAHAMTIDELTRTEALVRATIERPKDVFVDMLPLSAAMKINGVRAVFGEKYPDPVRVVSIGAAVETLLADPASEAWREHAIEFCGGTHLASTSDIGAFVITHEQGLAAGVRRITALTGAAADAAIEAGRTLEREIAEAETLDDDALLEVFDDLVGASEHLALAAVAKDRLVTRLDRLRERVKSSRRARQQAARRGLVDQAREIAQDASGELIVAPLDGGDKDALLAALDVVQARCSDAATMLFAVDREAGKVAIVAAVPEPLIARGLKAGDWIRVAATACGGGGGGRPDKAQAGGKDASKVDAACEAALRFARERLDA